ncbi:MULTISPECIES: LysE family translocator [Pseudomonas]|uniref:LysE family translocator n=1 Tax=Pseudomonas donghuensis TaxID=1163398 RepID=A0AAP0SEI3_9PSED|nr:MULTISPECIES: LysE family translocator [Pseudomonas]MDF9895541.1 threonine/homoserine/homoserine lactone efflux protein [Pseudomonas vranovensis]KDN97202.1 LysE family translocator [Pseudomonas donghuensis]MBF4208639.1 LysE family translocator [Pseudomonas donghuensis]MBS7597990.1 LysE family translocator [Pseudomonas sp. RC2C2]MCP6692796.1 LysE family translocator [Pseudomonas donghuensis]
MLLFLKSLLIGLCIAAPVGPIGLLCIQRSLTQGWRAGFATGLGAATADAIYGFIGALGISALITTLVGWKPWLCIFGGAFLAYVGYRIITSEATSSRSSGEPYKPWRAYSTTLLLTLSNPMTILSFIAIFAAISDGVGAGQSNSYALALMVTGIFLGSAGWWLGLSGFSALFATRLSNSKLKLINVFSASTITLLGVYQIITGVLLRGG